MLYVCATPIGNLEDITYRVVKILSSVDLIAAEDTRQSVKLLNHFNIKTPLTSYHEHNKDSKGNKLITMLKDGKDIALVSDAGMPGISDPGEDLIKLCYENDIKVTVAPGATAAVTAIVLSGLNARSYIFEGFLPKGKKQRQLVLQRLKDETRTTIFYEAPHHLLATLEDIYSYAGNRLIAIEKELTKKYEDVRRGSLEDMIQYYTQNKPQGEYVIVLEGANPIDTQKAELQKYNNITLNEHFNMYIQQGMDEKSAMKQVAKDRNIGKRDVYKEIKG